MREGEQPYHVTALQIYRTGLWFGLDTLQSPYDFPYAMEVSFTDGLAILSIPNLVTIYHQPYIQSRVLFQ
jgi:hypothetical protein